MKKTSPYPPSLTRRFNKRLLRVLRFSAPVFTLHKTTFFHKELNHMLYDLSEKRFMALSSKQLNEMKVALKELDGIPESEIWLDLYHLIVGILCRHYTNFLSLVISFKLPPKKSPRFMGWLQRSLLPEIGLPKQDILHLIKALRDENMTPAKMTRVEPIIEKALSYLEIHAISNPRRVIDACSKYVPKPPDAVGSWFPTPVGDSSNGRVP